MAKTTIYIVKAYFWEDNGIGSGETPMHNESIEAICSSIDLAKEIAKRVKKEIEAWIYDDPYWNGFDVDIIEEDLIDALEDKYGTNINEHTS